MEKKAKRYHAVFVRVFDPGLMDAIRKCADRDMRSISQWVCIQLAKAAGYELKIGR